ncbi:Zn-ribbon domain-containing OB-fold protein [Nonomuraea longicatena]|uniref:ChsH2 rubredoxin-like zinc ribbon domain-containing protein n=1 Tax=Nonomuraea longicatena TaxID=83682 RepID=A0ABN1QPJ3_9ACTN
MSGTVGDRDSAQWWERLARGEFVVQECDGCGGRRFPARAFCAGCRAEAWHWVRVDPVGRVETWTIGHRPFPEGTVVRIRLAAVPDATVFGGWAGERAPEYGQRVAAVLTTDGSRPLLRWRPRSG